MMMYLHSLRHPIFFVFNPICDTVFQFPFSTGQHKHHSWHTSQHLGKSRCMTEKDWPERIALTTIWYKYVSARIRSSLQWAPEFLLGFVYENILKNIWSRRPKGHEQQKMGIKI